MKDNTAKGLNYFILALIAFSGLGLEALYAFLIEPLIYNKQMQDWTIGQNIAHWIITCITWGIVTYILIVIAKSKYSFDIFDEKAKMRLWQWGAVALCILFSFLMSYVDWNGFKVVKEFRANGWLKFIFQYIYYIFETGLFTLIIVYGQKACEKWFKKENIPYGGIVIALTWGLAHILTKGNVMVGVLSAISGFAFGVVYLLVNRDIRKAFPILFIMFIF